MTITIIIHVDIRLCVHLRKVGLGLSASGGRSARIRLSENHQSRPHLGVNNDIMICIAC